MIHWLGQHACLRYWLSLSYLKQFGCLIAYWSLLLFLPLEGFAFESLVFAQESVQLAQQQLLFQAEL